VAETLSKSLFFKKEEAGPGIANVLVTKLGVRYGGAEESAAIAHEDVVEGDEPEAVFSMFRRST
jgi:hypothetical protein